MSSTRRAILAAVGAVASLFAARRSLGQTAAPTAVPSPTPAPGTTPTPAPAEPGPLARAARERFGKFLSPVELKMLDDEMASIERRGARLKEIVLQNGEEPAADFRVSRS